MFQELLFNLENIYNIGTSSSTPQVQVKQVKLVAYQELNSSCKDGNARFTTVPLNLYLIKYRDINGYF